MLRRVDERGGLLCGAPYKLAMRVKGVSLYAAANPEPLTAAVNVNGRVRVATSACAHKSLTSNAATELEMLSASKQLPSQVIFAAAPALFTNPSANLPPLSCLPHTLVLLHGAACTSAVVVRLHGNVRSPPTIRFAGEPSGS